MQYCNQVQNQGLEMEVGRGGAQLSLTCIGAVSLWQGAVGAFHGDGLKKSWPYNHNQVICEKCDKKKINKNTRIY